MKKIIVPGPKRGPYVLFAFMVLRRPGCEIFVCFFFSEPSQNILVLLS
jgi:hypothetical protein